jgi:Guanine nucleotide exchange factor synembryn
MEALCSPYDSLLVVLGADDSDKAWGSALRNFCSSHADTTCLPLEGKDLFLNGLKIKINEIACCRPETDVVCKLILIDELLMFCMLRSIKPYNPFLYLFSVITELCDCVRIAVRDKSHTDVLMCDKFIGNILSFAEREQADVSRMALRCLINLINENGPAFEIFLGKALNGLKRVVEVLRRQANGDECHQVKFLATKLLYMMLSQR